MYVYRYLSIRPPLLCVPVVALALRVQWDYIHRYINAFFVVKKGERGGEKKRPSTYLPEAVVVAAASAAAGPTKFERKHHIL